MNHNERLFHATKLVCSELKQGEEIHQVFSWDTNEWAFVALMDNDPFQWRVLLYWGPEDIGRVMDISSDFATAPTINTTYAELEL